MLLVQDSATDKSVTKAFTFQSRVYTAVVLTGKEFFAFSGEIQPIFCHIFQIPLRLLPEQTMHHMQWWFEEERPSAAAFIFTQLEACLPVVVMI